MKRSVGYWTTTPTCTSICPDHAQALLAGRRDKPDPKWVELVTRHPTRFVIGSDVVGHFENLATGMNAFAPFLDALPEAVAQGVARDNFPRVAAKRQDELR